MPEEIKQTKEVESKDLRKQLKKQKEAIRFELRYKKVKFTEKRKVIRKLQQMQAQLEAGSTPELLK